VIDGPRPWAEEIAGAGVFLARRSDAGDEDT
jgi:hypothetical protein